MSGWVPPEALHVEGAERRRRTPIDVLTAYQRAGGLDPVEVVANGNADRLPHLAPIRIGRMASSPFAFLRGGAAVLAADLAAGFQAGADTGLNGQICGDAHARNFGLYASPERRLVMDLNDFDETAYGPWDWDLKRLVVSLVCAGREARVSEDGCAAAARDCARAYRTAIAELAALPLLEGHFMTTDHATLEHYEIADLAETFDRVRRKARKNTSQKAAEKFTQALTLDAWHFVTDPPVLTAVTGAERAAVVHSLDEYGESLDDEIRLLLSRYAVLDVAHRIVGLGSVGFRSYVVLLRGNGDEALVLQLKQAHRSALGPYLPGAAVPAKHEGERVVRGQRWMQTVSDVLLGWTTIAPSGPMPSGRTPAGGLPFLVRQYRNMQGSIDPTTLRAEELDDYARVVGVVLARSHAQSIDPRVLSGYCGGEPVVCEPSGEEFDAGFAAFAVAGADRAEADHALLVAAVDAGRLPAEFGV